MASVQKLERLQGRKAYTRSCRQRDRIFVNFSQLNGVECCEFLEIFSEIRKYKENKNTELTYRNQNFQHEVSYNCAFVCPNYIPWFDLTNLCYRMEA